MFFTNLLAKKLFLLIHLRHAISLFLSKANFNTSIKHISLSHLAWLQCIFPIRLDLSSCSEYSHKPLFDCAYLIWKIR